jgi:hypothetical protein
MAIRPYDSMVGYVMLESFASEYNQLPPGEQAQFADAIRRLFADGLIWREDDGDRRIYSFLARRRALVDAYLQVAGWELRHDERATVYHIVHPEGAHRRRLNRDTSIWLLLFRLFYAEQRESPALSLTRYPVVTVSDVIARYNEFFPGQSVRTEQLIELLPTLEVVVPVGEIGALADRLKEYDRTQATADEE